MEPHICHPLAVCLHPSDFNLALSPRTLFSRPGWTPSRVLLCRRQGGKGAKSGLDPFAPSISRYCLPASGYLLSIK